MSLSGCRRFAVWTLMALIITAAGPAPGSWAATSSYQVYAFNDLGMHCIDPDFSVFAILPPYNVVHAQVVKKRTPPKFYNEAQLNSLQFRLIYSPMADPTGSINTTSIGKTNFWRFVSKLFGVSLPPDVGLSGAKMPNASFGPQPLNSYDPAMRWFTAAGIPLEGLDDNLKFNYYPLMNIQLVDANNTVLSSLPTVLPVSREQHCDACHATGSDAASPGFHGVQNWSTNTRRVIQYKENILILHDALHATNLRASQPVLCFDCHYSAALDLQQAGPTPLQQSHPNLSRAIHLRHGRPAAGEVPIPDDGASTCYYCHPGAITKCLRGAMATSGLICQDCHGGMLAVGGDVPLTTGQIRQPWIDLPKCQSCHTGDAADGMPLGQPLRVAYDQADPAATPRTAPTSVFAEENQKLFRFSSGHGVITNRIACESCHGSPHAEWPTMDPQGNDNLAATHIQGHAGPIIECASCHQTGSMALSLNGPHGLHIVNDSRWVAGHKTIYAGNPAKCQGCHGLTLSGTRLSRAAADRRFPTPMGNQVDLKQGRPVNCSLCHKNPLAL